MAPNKNQPQYDPCDNCKNSKRHRLSGGHCTLTILSACMDREQIIRRHVEEGVPEDRFMKPRVADAKPERSPLDDGKPPVEWWN